MLDRTQQDTRQRIDPAKLCVPEGRPGISEVFGVPRRVLTEDRDATVYSNGLGLIVAFGASSAEPMPDDWAERKWPTFCRKIAPLRTSTKVGRARLADLVAWAGEAALAVTCPDCDGTGAATIQSEDWCDLCEGDRTVPPECAPLAGSILDVAFNRRILANHLAAVADVDEVEVRVGGVYDDCHAVRIEAPEWRIVVMALRIDDKGEPFEAWLGGEAGS